MAGMTMRDDPPSFVMAGHSRPKDGVLLHAYVPAIHVFSCCNAVKTWMPGTGPGMTNERRCHSPVTAGHSRPKDGVLSHAYVPAIRLFLLQCCEDVDARHRAGHDE
jgi:hypothetical protein